MKDKPKKPDSEPKNDERFQKLFEKIPYPLCYLDKDRNIIYRNERFLSLIGYTIEEVPTVKSWWAKAYPDKEYREWVMERWGIAVAESALTGKDIETEAYKVRCKDGKDREILISGKIVGEEIIVSFIELNQTKILEKALEKSEERYRTILDNLIEGCQIIDREYRYIYLNKAAVIQSKNERENLVGRRMEDMYPGIEKTAMYGILERCMDERTYQQMENEFYFEDGTKGWFNLSFQPVPEGVLIMSTDITEPKKVEDALRKSEMHYRNLFDNMLNGYAYCKVIFEGEEPVDFVYLDVNKSFESLTGLKDVINKRVTEVIPSIEKTVPNPIKIYGDLSITGKPLKIEYYVDGLKKWISSSVYSLTKGYFVSVFEVITERKEAENEIKAKNDEISAQNLQYRLLNTELQKAKEIAEDSAYKLNLMLENAPEAIFIQTENKFVYVNSQALRLFGAETKEQLLHTPVIERIHPDFHPIALKRISELNNKKRTQNSMDMQFKKLDGSTIDVSVSGVPFIYANKNGALVFVSDITERKQAEKALKESEELYRTLFDNMLNGFAYCKMIYEGEKAEDFVYLDVNKSFEKQTGLKNVVNKKASEAIPGITKTDQKLLDIYGRVASTGKAEKIEYYVEAMKMWFSISLYSPKKGYFVAVFDVITEQKKAQEQIEKVAKHYQSLIEKAPDGILLIDAEGSYKFASNSARKSFGYTETEDITGIKSAEHIHPEDLPNVMMHLGRLMQDSTYIPTLQYRYQDRNKNWKWIESTFSNLLTDTVVESIIINFRDITDRKQAELEVQKLNIELEQRVIERTKQLLTANKELETFAYSVSHDLRAPLRAVVGFSKILYEEYGIILDDEGRRLLNVVIDNVKKMDALILDLLALSKVTRTELNKINIDMKTLAFSVYNELASEEIKKKFNITIHNIPDAKGDPVMMRQLWMNLISNAIKYTMPKTYCSIEIGYENKEGAKGCYYIKDNGVGFNPEYKHKLFGVFQRLHSTSEFEGTGIGLSIVQKIVDRHEGEVWAEGKVGEGAAFYFSIKD